jgi:hypothetical protein
LSNTSPIQNIANPRLKIFASQNIANHPNAAASGNITTTRKNKGYS